MHILTCASGQSVEHVIGRALVARNVAGTGRPYLIPPGPAGRAYLGEALPMSDCSTGTDSPRADSVAKQPPADAELPGGGQSKSFLSSGWSLCGTWSEKK